MFVFILGVGMAGIYLNEAGLFTIFLGMDMISLFQILVFNPFPLSTPKKSPPEVDLPAVVA